MTTASVIFLNRPLSSPNGFAGDPFLDSRVKPENDKSSQAVMLGLDPSIHYHNDDNLLSQNGIMWNNL